MSKFKGTKGKWTSVKPEGSNGYRHINNEELGLGQIATCYGFSFGKKNEIAYNAKLISCAPDMLEMLEAISNGETPNIFEIKELIRKATWL